MPRGIVQGRKRGRAGASLAVCQPYARKGAATCTSPPPPAGHSGRGSECHPRCPFFLPVAGGPASPSPLRSDAGPRAAAPRATPPAPPRPSPAQAPPSQLRNFPPPGSSRAPFPACARPRLYLGARGGRERAERPLAQAGARAHAPRERLPWQKRCSFLMFFCLITNSS